MESYPNWEGSSLLNYRQHGLWVQVPYSPPKSNLKRLRSKKATKIYLRK